MENNNNKKEFEKGAGLFLIGFLLMLSAVGLGYFDIVHNRVANTAAWIGFFLGASGIIINLSILKKNNKKRR